MAKQAEAKPVRKVILLDNDDFYGLTLDLVLFNLSQQSAIKVYSEQEFAAFSKALAAGDFQEAIYIIDEFYSTPTIASLASLLNKIKAADPKATLICYTVSQPEEVANKELYDKLVLKTSRELDKSLAKTLSDILGVVFIADNNDPEREALK